MRVRAVGIIPARWASTRFPGKPLYSIVGKPLLQYVWEASRRAKRLDHLIIATDDFRIAEAAFAWGAEVAMTSANHSSGTDRIAEVAAKAGVKHLLLSHIIPPIQDEQVPLFTAGLDKIFSGQISVGHDLEKFAV